MILGNGVMFYFPSRWKEHLLPRLITWMREHVGVAVPCGNIWQSCWHIPCCKDSPLIAVNRPHYLYRQSCLQGNVATCYNTNLQPDWTRARFTRQFLTASHFNLFLHWVTVWAILVKFGNIIDYGPVLPVSLNCLSYLNMSWKSRYCKYVDRVIVISALLFHLSTVMQCSKC